MTRPLAALAFALPLALFALIVPSAGEVDGTATHPAAEAERERVRAHLLTVETRLRAADPGSLTAEQRAARARQIEVLREYIEAGVFPHNHSHDRRVPVFVDEHGTHCAVGYLLARSGATAVVRRIAERRNNATVPELADEPGLLEWLEANGLTAEEAAAIQPTYGPVDLVETDRGYSTAATLFVAASAATSTWNLLGPGTASGIGGLVAGAGALAWGIHGLGRERVEPYGFGQRTVEAAPADILLSFVGGAVAAGLGTWTLLREKPRAPEATSTSGMTLELAPAVRAGGAGLRAAVRF